VAQRIGGGVLRTTSPQASLWEAILPAEALGLPAELTMVDRLLDDPVFIQPFRTHFDPIIGRPSVPIDTYLRMMFLKFRYRLGYELLCREVADSISWQRFCRIPLGGRVPHPTTLVKLTRRLGEQTVEGLNQALLARAAERKLLRTHKLRADTTVVTAKVTYPTDLGLLARAVDKLHTTATRVQAAGGATRTRVRDRRRAVRRRAHQVARAMRSRTDQAKQVVFEVTGQVARLAEAQLADTRRVLAGARRALARGRARPAGRLRAVVEELQTAIGRTQRVLDQANTRLAGGMPDGPAGWSACTTRTPARSARAASAGRSSSATRPRSSTTPTGSSWTTPSWSATHPMRRCWPRHQTGHRPHRQGARSGDHRPGLRRGPHRPGADRARGGPGRDPATGPRRSRPPSGERQRGFRRLVKWRTGCEGRISCLKHRFGWDRTRMDGIHGARIWCGHGVFAHNLVKIGGLLEAKHNTTA
jgi:transposase, IS5 family